MLSVRIERINANTIGWYVIVMNGETLQRNVLLCQFLKPS